MKYTIRAIFEDIVLRWFLAITRTLAAALVLVSLAFPVYSHDTNGVAEANRQLSSIWTPTEMTVSDPFTHPGVEWRGITAIKEVEVMVTSAKLSWTSDGVSHSGVAQLPKGITQSYAIHDGMKITGWTNKGEFKLSSPFYSVNYIGTFVAAVFGLIVAAFVYIYVKHKTHNMVWRFYKWKKRPAPYWVVRWY